MIAILLVGLVAGCAAAPYFPPGSPPYHPDPAGFGNYDPFEGEYFDTNRFWSSLANDLHQLDTYMTRFYERFPARPPITSTQGVVGDEYRVTISLSGFAEKDIVVKAREGVLMVQAVHELEDGGRNSYLNVNTLPPCIDVKGSWTFEEGVLKIVFRMKPGTTEEANTPLPITEAPVLPVTEETSREELGPRTDVTFNSNTKEDTDTDADVGIRGDPSFNNEISRTSVEATTYAVDFNDQFELIPIK